MGGQSVTNAFGSFSSAYASGGEGVIAHHHAIAAMGNIDACRIVLDVGPGESFQPEVECVAAAVEAAQIVVSGQLLYDERGDGCHLAAFGNGRACEQTLQPWRHFRRGVESFDKRIPRLGRQNEMVLVRQVHLSLRARRIDDVLGEVGVAPRRPGLDEAGLARSGTNMESLRLGRLVLRGVWHIVPVLIVRLLYACGTSDQAYLDPPGQASDSSREKILPCLLWRKHGPQLARIDYPRGNE